MRKIHDNGSSSESYRQFKLLVNSSNLEDVPQSALHLISFLEVRSVDRGSVDNRAKSKSRNQRWFTAKKTSLSKDSADKNVVGDGQKKVGMDALVELRCKRGRRKTSEYHRVLGVFHKYYNKWFVHPQEFVARNGSEKQEDLKKTRVLAKLVEKTGSCVRDVELKTDGSWGAATRVCHEGTR